MGVNGLKPGTVVGRRYRVLEKAAEGGLGEVYLAEDLVAGGRVALKVGRGPVPGTPPDRKPPAHPNLARLTESGEWDGRPYQVFEWVEGTDLAAYLRLSGRPDLPTACRLGAQVAAGLAALHAAGLVHGDVKPRNVMVTPGAGSPTVKLVDFGSAADDWPVAATPLYAGPEVLAGRRPSPAADAFGLGLLLFELLTGLGPPPNAGQTGPLRPARWNPAVPPALDDLVARLTAPEPHRRPADLEAVARTLEAWANPDLTPTVPLRPTARLQPSRRPRGRPPALAAVLTGLILAFGVLLGLSLTRSAAEPKPPPPPPTAPVPAVVRLPADRAVEILVAAGFRPEARRAYSSVPAGLVVDQDPPAGTAVAPGAAVTLTVSAGPPPTQPEDDRRGPGRGKKRGRDD